MKRERKTGYAAIALWNPKNGENVGGAMRAAGVYEAQLVVLGGGRRPNTLLRHPTDTMKTWASIPTIATDDVFDAIPYDCVPVAIELVDGAKPLPDYWHPARAMYIFGPEDGSLPTSIIERCSTVLYVPTPGPCMNLAATVNVVLYDRLVKRRRILGKGE